MSVRAVIFDLDDTLIDQKAAANPAVIAWAEELGIDMSDVTERWHTIGHHHYMRYQSREISFQEQRRERVRELLGKPLSDLSADALFNGYLRRYEAGWTIFKDAIPCLEYIRAAGLKIAILTNGERSQQMQKIRRFGLENFVDEIVCSSDLPAGKPDPRAFQEVLKRLGVSADDALMVGDSIESDVNGARATGIDAVLIDRAATSLEPSAIRTLGELRFVSRHEHILRK